MIQSSKLPPPKVSVVIPLFNHESFIAETISSVLNQSFTDFELVIIDDGSTDRSIDVVKTFNDQRIKFYSQQNQGAHKTINRGVKRAQGDYIAILNSDDVYHAQRLEECVRLLDSDDSVAAVFTYIECVDAKGNFVRYQEESMDNYYQVKALDDAIRLTTSEKLIAGNFLFTTSNLVCRKTAFDEIGYFSDLRYLHDYDFFLRLTDVYNIHLIKKYLLKYRFHENNTLNQNYPLSIFETGMVLSSFLLKHVEANQYEQLDDNKRCELMDRFYRTVNTYGSDRLIITFLLYGRKSHLLTLMKSKAALSFRQTVLSSFVANNEFRDNIAWQEQQTSHWWRKAHEYKIKGQWQEDQKNNWWKENEQIRNHLLWQKEQTDKWWQESQQNKAQLSWQKEKTHKWWQESQQNKEQLSWQKEQTHKWWQESQQNKEQLSWQKEQTDVWWQAYSKQVGVCHQQTDEIRKIKDKYHKQQSKLIFKIAFKIDFMIQRFFYRKKASS